MNKIQLSRVQLGMMKKLITFSLLATFGISSMSCQTSYDSYGNPRQTMDPGVAVAGVAAAGVLAYAIGRDKKDDKRYSYYNSPNYHQHYRRPYYRRY